MEPTTRSCSFVRYETFAKITFALPADVWRFSCRDSGSLDMCNVNVPVFLLAVSMIATWQLSYAPYVADYSRYLPVTTPTSHTFWYSYAGTVIGTIWMMSLGSALTTVFPKFLDHTGANLAHLFGLFAIIMYLVIIFGQLAINVLNLYGAFM